MKSLSRSWFLLSVSFIVAIAGCNPAKTDSSTSTQATKSSEPSELFDVDGQLASMEKLVVKRNDKGEVVELDCRECDSGWLEQADALVGKLPSLRSLRLQGDAAVAVVAKFSSVRNVYLYGDQITNNGVEKLSGLQELRVVNLIQTAVADNGCGFLKTLPNLKEFGCFGTSLSHGAIKSIAKPDGISKLNLRASAITDEGLIEVLPTFQNLESLELSENASITDKSMAAIVAMPKLVDVNFWLTKITDAGVAQLEGKPLKRLNLDNIPEITNKSIETAIKIKSLEFLHLGKTSVDDEWISQMATLPNLTELHLTQSKVTPATVEKLRVAMPKTKIVYGRQP